MKKLTVPLSLDPRHVDRHYLREPILRNRVSDPELDALRSALKSAHEAAESILDGREAISADLTRPPAARAVATRQLALKRGEAAAARLDAARAKVTKARDQLANEISAPVVPGHQAHLATEVRARLANMSDDARARVLDHSMRSGDALTIGAYLTGPAYLSGAGEGDQQMLRARWQSNAHPVKLSRVERIGKAIQAVERAGTSLVGLVETIANDPAAAMGERARVLADQAMKAEAKDA